VKLPASHLFTHALHATKFDRDRGDNPDTPIALLGGDLFCNDDDDYIFVFWKGGGKAIHRSVIMMMMMVNG